MAWRTLSWAALGLLVAGTWLCEREVQQLFRRGDESQGVALAQAGVREAPLPSLRNKLTKGPREGASGNGPVRVATQLDRRLAGESLRERASSDDAENASVFNSLADCEMLLARGHHAPRAKGTVRLGAWNVRWFPDGDSDDTTNPARPTNVRWLGCALAWLDLEAFALAEVKSKPRSTLALEALVSQLNEFTGGRYAYRMDECPESNGQHLVWFWNEKLVQVRGFRLHGAINPHGEACAGRLRPGFGVSLAFASGLDFHAIAVHLKSGHLRDDMALRRKSLEGLGGVVSQIAHDTFDSDVIVLGDMNSMGCEGCEGLDNSAAEAMAMDTHLAALHVPMRRVPSDMSCSEYYDGQPSLLDHFFVTSAAREIPRQVKAEVQGYCRDLACESFPVAEASKGGALVPQAFTELSDHCPIVLSIIDQDLD